MPDMNDLKAYDDLYAVIIALFDDKEMPVESVLDALAIHAIRVASQTKQPTDAYRYFMASLDRTISSHRPNLKGNLVEKSEPIPPSTDPDNDPRTMRACDTLQPVVDSILNDTPNELLLYALACHAVKIIDKTIPQKEALRGFLDVFYGALMHVAIDTEGVMEYQPRRPALQPKTPGDEPKPS